MQKYHLSSHMLGTMVEGLALKLRNNFVKNEGALRIYPVTPQTVPLIYLLSQRLNVVVAAVSHSADLALDLVFETGRTCKQWQETIGPEVPFYVLVDKSSHPCDFKGQHIVFPWEPAHIIDNVKVVGEMKTVFNESVIEQLLYDVISVDKREGLIETPARVVKAWKHWTSGYSIDIPSLLKVFEDGADGYDQMVIVKDIPIYSKCEHHLADIFGTATIAYIPNGKIVGLSKLSRLADAFARRLQVQERLTCQIADALNDNLLPQGVGVIIKARHMCMESRGICQQGHHTITSALRGCIKDDPLARQEFMSLAM